ncbi:MAG: hypothetical protein AB1755_01790 [Candidatus Omnitrophota bacterium]
MQSKIFRLVFVFLLFSGVNSFAQEETITLSTYYPAPYGVYNELKAKRMWIGTTGEGAQEQFLSGGFLALLQVGGIYSPPEGAGSDYGTTLYAQYNRTRDYASAILGQGLVGRNDTMYYGVHGQVNSGMWIPENDFNEESFSAGVYGETILPDNSRNHYAHGVAGKTNSARQYSAGVFGKSTQGPTYGVYGVTSSTFDGAAGLYGEALAIAGNTYGVLGLSHSNADSPSGVMGYVADDFPENSLSDRPTGVFGYVDAGDNHAYGVMGRVSWTGVHNRNAAVYGLIGDTNRIFNFSASVFGQAALFENNDVHGVAGAAQGVASCGVYGWSDQYRGVEGFTRSDQSYGGYFTGGKGLYGSRLMVGRDTDYGDNIAVFTGNVYIKGNFDVTGVVAARVKNFVIDHPLNPQNKDLVHACIEGPEVAVYYRGEAQLKDGKVEIILPAYFEKLTRKENRTLQLTCIDGASLIYLDGKIADSKFKVATTKDGNQNQKFYWEVKAVRADVEPLKVEVSKTGVRPRK